MSLLKQESSYIKDIQNINKDIANIKSKAKTIQVAEKQPASHVSAEFRKEDVVQEK